MLADILGTAKAFVYTANKDPGKKWVCTAGLMVSHLFTNDRAAGDRFACSPLEDLSNDNTCRTVSIK